MKVLHQEYLSAINSNYTIKERLLGGMSNYTYLIEDNHGKKYVFRVPGDMGEPFVNYKTEKQNMEMITYLEINSQTIYYDTEKGFKISTYIEGDVPSLEKLHFFQVVATMKKLHTSELSLSENYNHLLRLEKYESICSSKKSDLYLALKKSFVDIYNQRLDKNINYPCHCDAQIANFILEDTGKLYLLDWEFAGTNDYIYDIASFGNRDFNDAINLLNTYSPNPSNDEIHRLYSWRMFQCLQWHNVAQYKHEVGLGIKLNVEFDKVANNYLIIAESMFKNSCKYFTYK